MKLNHIAMARVISRAKALLRDRRGLALVEFAYATPIIVALGTYGLELSNFATCHLRASQIASNLADTTSRIGEFTPLAVKQIREADINDAFQAVRQQSGNLDMPNRGRIILSSLERNSSNGQWIRWQRCLGKGVFTSSYGNAGDGATGTSLLGMGDAGRLIAAPPKSAVMFVEIVVPYKAIVGEALLGAQTIRAKAAFLVRDVRDLSSGNDPANPAPTETASTCNLFNA